ncbi:transposable element Tcb1 transposase [Trichonephila clavipes]|nr:transposable element Tcb1 transposase [Trichonephila clavipes]
MSFTRRPGSGRPRQTSHREDICIVRNARVQPTASTTFAATHATVPRSHFSTRQCSASHGKGSTRLSPHCVYPYLVCPIPRFVSNRAYLEPFGSASWASHEFERTRGMVTANMERNISRHRIELVCLNARSYHIVHSR